jgi:DNA polymerase delta subunit 3
VTKEEAAWESFSEDEPESKKPRISVAPTNTKKSGAAAKGQGNIMNFFKKK